MEVEAGTQQQQQQQRIHHTFLTSVSTFGILRGRCPFLSLSLSLSLFTFSFFLCSLFSFPVSLFSFCVAPSAAGSWKHVNMLVTGVGVRAQRSCARLLYVGAPRLLACVLAAARARVCDTIFVSGASRCVCVCVCVCEATP